MSQDKDYFAYKLIEEDYLTICKFINPEDANNSVFSHKTYELYLRVCTEFESVCKNELVRFAYSKAVNTPQNLNIQDYELLFTNQSYHGQRLNKEVGLQFWQPQMKFIKPFDDWNNSQPLGWYQSYNKVKHNRDSNFHLASLENLTLSFAGYFLLIQVAKGWGFFQPFRTMRSMGSSSNIGSSADGCIFRVR